VLVNDRSRECRTRGTRRELEAFRNDRDRRRKTVHRHETGQRGRFDARDEPGLFDHTLEEPLRVRLAVTQLARREAHHQQMIRSEARTAAKLLLKSAIHKRGYHEKDHGDGHLAAHEQRAAPPPAPPETRGVCRLHHRRQIRASRSDCRHQPEQDGAEQCDDNTDQQHTLIELERRHDREIRRDLKPPEQPHAGVADAKAEVAADRRNQHALGDQLPDNPGTSGPDGQSHGDLAAPGRSPARQQSRDVGARDEQHGRREKVEHQEQPRNGWRSDDPRLQLGTNGEVLIPVRVWVGSLQIAGNN
jgi:hypothetical protein